MASSETGESTHPRSAHVLSIFRGRRGVIVPALLPSVALLVVAMVVAGITVAVTDMDSPHWWPLTLSLWMAVFHVPFTGIGPTGFVTVMGFLPLLPTLLYIVFLAWVARRFIADDIPADTQLFSLLSILIPLIFAGIGWGGMWGMRGIVFIQPPHAGVMVGMVFFITLVGITIGLREHVLYLIPHARDTFPSWGKAGFSVTEQFLCAMLMAGSIASVVALIAHWNLIGQVLNYGNSAAGIAGFGVFSLLYLPNMMVAAATILSGGGIHVGLLQTSLYATHLDKLPAFPLFAALPQDEAQTWWLIFLTIPIAAAIVVACRTPGETVQDRLKAIAFATPTTAACAALGAWLAGGEIGVMGSVRMSEGLTGLILAAWIGILGSVTVFVQRGEGFASIKAAHSQRRAKKRAVDERDDESDDVEEDVSEEKSEEKDGSDVTEPDENTDTSDSDTSENSESADTVENSDAGESDEMSESVDDADGTDNNSINTSS